MIIGFLLCAVLVLAWLPWWVLCVLSVVFGVLARWSWRSAIVVGGLVAFITVAICFYFDRDSSYLISRRIAGVLSMPPQTLVLLPGLINAWIVVFFARMGAVARRLIQAEGNQ